MGWAEVVVVVATVTGAGAEGTIVEEAAAEEEAATLLELVLPFLYSCSLLPAPQKVVLSPGQRNEQSAWLSALTLPSRRVSPQ